MMQKRRGFVYKEDESSDSKDREILNEEQQDEVIHDLKSRSDQSMKETTIFLRIIATLAAAGYAAYAFIHIGQSPFQALISIVSSVSVVVSVLWFEQNLAAGIEGLEHEQKDSVTLSTHSPWQWHNMATKTTFEKLVAGAGFISLIPIVGFLSLLIGSVNGRIQVYSHIHLNVAQYLHFLYLGPFAFLLLVGWLLSSIKDLEGSVTNLDKLKYKHKGA
ncbi:hypothetical protein HK100_007239 [Physocladia obscura]|uniref:Uncharacterized protein n=1 Tax=Physocladia obscura TaxID=109957 RepID=A0AAD5T5I2_9FUNG|nr:hypothetical protein HK100_007239 [Physocladia obscura]